jgi:NAD(P)-dependent dehydrogenase (short-subunit alcohol dehydrogenase family)
MDLGLAGRRVLITGASRGIGSAVAACFAAEGARPILAGRDRAALEAVAAETGAEIVVGDMRAPADLEALIEAGQDVDILVNNAGATPTGRIDQVGIDEWREGLELKVIATAALTKGVYAAMCDRRAGVIVNVIGNCGERPDADIIIATVTNTGMMGFTRALGAASPAHGVRVLGVNPGPTATERLVHLMQEKSRARTGDPGRWRELTAPLPFGRASTPKEQAATVVFAASDRATYTSGTILTVDGGVAWRGHLF